MATAKALLVRTALYWHRHRRHARSRLNRSVIALLHLPEAIVVSEYSAGPIRFTAPRRLEHDRYHCVAKVPGPRP